MAMGVGVWTDFANPKPRYPTRAIPSEASQWFDFDPRTHVAWLIGLLACWLRRAG